MGALMQLAIQYFGEQQASKMTQQQLDLFKQQLERVNGIKLPDLPQVQAEQLGPSAVAGMQTDQDTRGKQLHALAELQNIIDSGGLDLSDKAGLEDALNSYQEAQHSAHAGVAADAAARGQLNSGTRLMMDMDATQKGANAQRQNDLDVAAQAQRRKLAAIGDYTSGLGNMREMDWREKEAGAQAQDYRDQRNADAREKAGYYNAGLPQQGFQNAMQKAVGAGAPTGNLAAAYGQAGADARTAAAGYGKAAYEGARGSGSGGGGDTSDAFSYDTEKRDENGDRGGYTDLSKYDPNK